MKTLVRSALVTLCLALLQSQSYAYSVLPMVADLKPTGAESSRLFTIENNSNEKISLHVSATTRTISVDGKENRLPTQDFNISPNQLDLNAGEKKSVRITYVGKKDITVQAAYRIAFDQPTADLEKVEKSKSKDKVNFIFNYVTAVYVSPEKVSPKVQVVSVEKVSGDKVRALFENSGSAYKLLSHYRILISNGQQEALISEDDSKLVDGVNLLPQSQRQVLFRIPASIKKAEKYEIRLKPSL